MRKSNCAQASRPRWPHPGRAFRADRRGDDRPWLVVLLLAIIVGSCIRSRLFAAEVFPQRPIRIVVYTGPGGLLDTMARKFVDVGRKYTSATLYVENRPGAGGIVALDGVEQGPADGYTWLAVTKSNVAKILLARRAELFDAFDWRATLVVDPECLIVTKTSGLTSLADWELEAKQIGGMRRNWLGPAAGGLDHVTAAKIWDQLHVDGQWIPYGSGGEAISALLGGQGRVYVGNPSDASSNPELRVLAISSPQRLAEHPDVPTMSEVGLTDLDHQFMWRGFAAKRGCPLEALQWFDQLCEQVSRDDEWREFWQSEGAQVHYTGPAQTAEQVRVDREEFATYHRKLGLSAEPASAKSLHGQRWNLGAMLVLALAAWIPAGRVLMERLRERPTRDWLIPAILQGLFVVMSWQSESLRNDTSFGAATLPRVWLLGGIALSPLVVRRVAARLPDTSATTGPTRRMAVVGFIAMGLIYFAGLATVGFYLASTVTLVAMMWWLGYRRWLTMAGTTSIWLLFVYWGLERTLHLPMPRGWWTS